MSEGETPYTGTFGDILGSDAAGLLVAAHELKSPLALIRQLAFALEEEGLTEAEYSRTVMQMRLTSEKALRLTGNLTRASRENLLLDVEPLNPVAVCEEVAHELTPLYAAQNRAIEVHTRAHAPLVVGNRDLLRRVLLNFGDNALYYATDDHPAILKVTKMQQQVRIGVRDYGPAVPVDVWRRLNERLRTSAHQAIGARPASSGLGLSIAGQFARMMQGTIGATRHHNGATFYVDLMASHQLRLL